MKNKKIIGALIGLTGTIENKGNTDFEDSIIWSALGQEDNEEILHIIEQEKNRLSPSCKICPNPCGNTSDYDLSRIQDNLPGVQKRKKEILKELPKLAQRRRTESVPEIVFKALSSLRYEFPEEYYEKLLEEMKNDSQDYPY